MGVSDYGAEQWAGVMFGITALPANLYLALCTDEPGDGWDGTVLATVEPVDPGVYARPAVAFGSGWVVTASGFVTNAAVFDFATPSVDWGNITHYALCDAATGGDLWFYGSFFEPLVVPAGYDLQVGAGSLSIGVRNQQVSIVVGE